VEDRIKDICRNETLIDQKQHLALEMLTPRTAHAEMESENIPVKQQQGKA
jgi:hypothetical protein